MSQTNNDEEYDDLDDLLVEDPATLDGELEKETSNVGEKAYTSKEANDKEEFDDVDDPEVKEMMENLQDEFSKLMKETDGKGDGKIDPNDKEAMENFKLLLHSLNDTRSINEESQDVPSSQNSSVEPGFKNVVSNTLDRLKENGAKIDSKIEEEKKEGQSDDVLSQLLNQLVDGDSTNFDEDGMDNAIVNILNQMSSKEVLYGPMKEMQADFIEWFKEHENDNQHKDKMETYKKQSGLVDELVAIYEKGDYSNDTYRNEITQLLDDLEQLGDSPVSKGFNTKAENGNEMDEISKLLEIDSNDKNMGNLNKELEDTCKQQ